MSLADQRELHARAVALANTAGLFATNTALLRRRDARARAVQDGVTDATAAAATDGESLREAAVETEIARLRRRIADMTATLTTRSARARPAQTRPMDRAASHIVGRLERKNRAYDAALLALANKNNERRTEEAAAKVINADPAVVRIEFSDQVMRTIAEVDDTIASIRLHVRTEERLLADETTNLADLEALNARLEERRAELLQKAEDERDADEMGRLDIAWEKDRLEKKVRMAMARNKNLEVHLSAFLAKHFPRPDDEKDQETGRRIEFTRLNDMVEELLNSAVNDDPSQRWVRITREHFPPYVELVLRSGVAVQDDTDPTRMRLVDFQS